MEEYKVEHLPVVKGSVLLGTISESVLMNADEESLFITGLELFQTAIEQHQHLYDVISLMAEKKLTLIPVTDEKGFYLGQVTAKMVIHELAKSQALTSEGSIVVLEMNKRDYSLAEIARLAESNKMELTLKVNKQDIQPFMQTLNRYDYEVKAFFKAPDHADDLQNRYEEFMRYLNI